MRETKYFDKGNKISPFPGKMPRIYRDSAIADAI